MTEGSILNEPLFSSDSDFMSPVQAPVARNAIFFKGHWKPRTNQKEKVKKTVGNDKKTVGILEGKNNDGSGNIKNHSVIVEAIVHENKHISFYSGCHS